MTLHGLLCLAVGLAAAWPAEATAQRTQRLVLEGIEVLLYFPQTGAFSHDIAGDSTDLWNTPIGEGIAGAPSTDSFVRVTVTGAPGTYMPGTHIAVEVTGRGRIMLSRRKRLGALGPGGRLLVGFWVYDTGCQPLRVTAHLETPTGRRSSVSTVVRFECAE